MLKKLFRTGVYPQLSSYLRIKVILSNQIALIMLGVELLYGTVAWLHFPVIVPLYLTGFFCTVLVFFLNYLHLFNLSRFLVAVFPTLIAGFTYLAVSQDNQNIILEILLVTFSMMLSPFMMFDGRESRLRNIAFLICSVPFICNKVLNEWVDIKIDASVLKTDLFIYFNIALSVMVVFAFLTVLQNTSQKAEVKSQQLLKEMEEAKQEMEGKGKMLENTLKDLEKAKVEDEKRSWAANGIAQFATLLRIENETETLYDSLISGIVKYVNANQGSLFTVETDEREQKYIELAACYAYDKKKYLTKKIEVGQGLIGQCYLEKQKILLTQVPNHYIKITSGLGETNPNCIFIMPVMINGEVEALLEIASFQVFETHEIEFLEKLGENIASVIRNTRINTLTKQLLEETRQQAEEMKAQEEEMRQNMEEMMATQEEMTRREEEIRMSKEELLDVIKEKEAEIMKLQKLI